MFTLAYRGYFIGGYCDRDECTVIHATAGRVGVYKNMAAAKRKIAALNKVLADMGLPHQ